MFAFLTVIEITVITALFHRYWRWSFAPKRGSGKISDSKKRIEEALRTIDPIDFKGEEVRGKVSRFFRNFPLLGLSDVKYEEISRYIDALDWRPEYKMKPEDIFFHQIMGLLTATVIVAIPFMYSRVLGVAVYAI